jgi:hypothetical protein
MFSHTLLTLDSLPEILGDMQRCLLLTVFEDITNHEMKIDYIKERKFLFIQRGVFVVFQSFKLSQLSI